MENQAGRRQHVCNQLGGGLMSGPVTKFRFQDKILNPEEELR